MSFDFPFVRSSVILLLPLFKNPDVAETLSTIHDK
jgi:hypothetical protein